MKQYKRIIAAFLALLLMLQITVPALAQESNTPKEEVVYISLNQDGSVREIYVVNIFALDENGRIIDYGEYETLRNMTTTDEIGYSDSKVTIDTTVGKLYYEGKLAANAIPWNISIHYFMDGVEYTAGEIAGKSGMLKITMSIRQNLECNSSFFEGYALQASFVLDTKKCRDIVADGATIANVGSDKQLTYTILPNKETDIEITANVNDFEMDGISINGIQLNMDIEIDDAKLQSKIDEIKDAVNELDDGTTDLSEGTDTLYSATGTLEDKVGELHAGVGSLSAGADKLYSGLARLTEKSRELNNAALYAYSALCTAAQTQLNAELTANGMDTVTLTPDTYSAVLMDILSKMDANLVYEQAYNAALLEVTAQVEAQADQLYYMYIQSQADTIYMQTAMQLVYRQLIEAGYTDEQAYAYLQTQEGQALVAQTVAGMTDEQKVQILQSALESLSDEQKKEIRDAYIKQIMASEEITNKIAAVVAQVNVAAAKVAELKGQLDSYGAFYNGLLAYTAGVSEAASGANALQGGLDTLYSNTEILKDSVGELNTAAGKLNDGAKKISDGTGEFAGEVSGMNDEVSDEIDSMISSMSGEDAEIVSFVSEQNTNIKSVQFVIKTDAIQIEEADTVETEQEETLNFWQKLMHLFGL
ncbi:MAG: hypothetical protein ACI4GD_05850 [Lachnospiraceae bacterium]